MKRMLTLAILLAGLPASSRPTAKAESWAGWRGPCGDGTSLEQNVPTNWDPADALWKIEIPGQGHASPIVWGDRVCTVTALPATQERVLLCLDRASGKTLWQQTVVRGPLEKLNKENSYASSTPATDGDRVFVTFRVGDDLFVAAHDLTSGKQLWLVRPGGHTGEWGFNNEPVVFRDKVIVDGDSKGESFLVALRRTDGKTLWRVKRSHQGIIDLRISNATVRTKRKTARIGQCIRAEATGTWPAGRLLRPTRPSTRPWYPVVRWPADV